LFKS
jgi:hypothetical protein